MALMSNSIKSLVDMQNHSRTMVSVESGVLDAKESMWIDNCESQIVNSISADVEVLLGRNAENFSYDLPNTGKRGLGRYEKGLLRSLLGFWNGNRYPASINSRTFHYL